MFGTDLARISRGSCESYLPIRALALVRRSGSRLEALLAIKETRRQLGVPVLRPQGTAERDFVLEPSVSMILASCAALLYATSATAT